MAEFLDTAPLNKPPDTTAKLLSDALLSYFSLEQTLTGQQGPVPLFCTSAEYCTGCDFKT